jgi:DNA polymerase-3 subunit alpha
LDWYYDVFGKENFFFELQQHNIKELDELNRKLLELGPRYEANYVATNDVHYINPEDARLQDILLAVQTGSLLADTNRMRMSDPSYYLRTPQEMAGIFADIPSALSNTVLIAERCNVDLSFKGYHLPEFSVPQGHTWPSYLRFLCEAGIQRRYREHAGDENVRTRLDYELGIINKMGFDAYFLIVWDLCKHARERGIWYNARGSAAGSIVAYSLDITLVDPIEHDLLFERFLNPGRISMPDIDLDFPDDRRAEMLEYTAQKYGNDKVAQIITFGTMGAKAAIRDVGRVMDIPLHEVDRVTKLVQTVQGKTVTLQDNLDQSQELKAVYNSNPTMRELLDTSILMEGVVRNAGTHAAGVVISDLPLVDYLPLHRPTSNSEETPIKSVTQFEMGILDSLGMLKVDFLGLATLTIMARACEMIKERHGIQYTLDDIPLDDPKAFELMGAGNTAGMFQVEGSGMTRYLIQMKPQKLENVIAMVALYRPGPMAFIPDYIDRMHGRKPTEYRHESLRPIFESTYGIPVYQEQLMRAAVELAGYTPSDADDLRKAISKKISEKIQSHRLKFVIGANQREIDETTANAIFSDWEEFARYGFNKSHAADYGVIAVQTAFLKAKYPAEFFTALLSVNKNDNAKVAFYSADSRNMGIEVLPPDINTSAWDFAIEDQPEGRTAIRFGLGAIKNVGQNPVEIFIQARGTENAPFKDLNDLARRADLRAVGKRALECLIKVGALDCFGPRPALLACMDRLVAISSSHFRSAMDGQLSLFGEATGVHENIILPEVPDIDQREQLNWEKDLLGLYVSEHPLTSIMSILKDIVTCFSSELSEVSDQEPVRVAGLVAAVRPYQTKNGKMMGFVTVEDIQGNIDLVLFPRIWSRFETLLEIGTIVFVEGKVDAASAPPKILVDKISKDFKYVHPADEGIPPGVRAKEVPVPEVQPVRLAQTSLVAEPAPSEFEEDNDPNMPPPPEAFPPGWDETPMPAVAKRSRPARQVIKSPKPKPEITAKPENVSTSAKDHIQVPKSSRQESPPAPRPMPRANSIQAPAKEDHAPQMVTVTLRSAGEPIKDQRRIQRLHGAFISCPGRDHFALYIKENGHSFMMEFPNDTTHVCPELLADIKKIVSENDISIEPILYH